MCNVPLAVKFPIVDERVVFALPALTPAAQASAFQRLAARRIAQIDADNARAAGLVIPHRLIVDGAPTPDLSRVTAKSAIVARWSVGVAAVDYIRELLQGAGPFKDGDYREGARMYVDGVESRDPRDAQGAREVLFLSIVPYARKIERGLKGYAPGHVYEAVADMARARYGNAARIKFTYAVPEGPAPELTRWAATSATAAAQRKRKGRDNPMRQPAILVILDE